MGGWFIRFVLVGDLGNGGPGGLWFVNQRYQVHVSLGGIHEKKLCLIILDGYIGYHQKIHVLGISCTGMGALLGRRRTLFDG
jgi:hypothetical protein